MAAEKTLSNAEDTIVIEEQDSEPTTGVSAEPVAWHIRFARFFTVAIVVVYGSLFVGLAASSLCWRILHDLPCMLYYGYLIEHLHYVPFRDFFDVNLPGADLAYAVIGRISQYSDLGIRLVDLSLLAILLAITFAILRRFGGQASWAGAVLFGLMYLGRGPSDSLQREFLLMLPLSAAILVAFTERLGPEARAVAVGLLFGLCAIIKPHALLASPLVIWYLLPEATGKRSKVILVAIVGMAIPMAAMFLYLWANSALVQFFSIERHVLPVYGSFAYRRAVGEWVPITGTARISHLVGKTLEFAGLGIWWLPTIAGLVTANYSAGITGRRRRQLGLLAGFVVYAAIYPAFSGQFIGYHYIPLTYFFSVLSALCLVPLPAKCGPIIRLAPIATFVLMLMLRMEPPEEFTQGVEPPKNGRVDEIARFLKANMRDGDRVQPLDWTGGVLHAMLITRSEIATPFVADVYFYLKPSDPYFSALRQRFIRDLERTRPRFIIDVLHYRIAAPGENTTRPFAELEKMLRRDYRIVVWRASKSYTIYERREPGTPQQTPAQARELITLAQ